jgi:hypothetical protein
MNQWQGHGSYQWPDGANYEGNFHKGLRHGEGLYMFQDGSVYRGEWKRGKYHGRGECHWAVDAFTRVSGYLEKHMDMDSKCIRMD